MFTAFETYEYINFMTFMMKPETTNSWIFLAIAMSSESPTTIARIIEVADGINHAYPTDKELQAAFDWLSKHDLVLKEGKHFQLTKKGLTLYKEANSKSKRIFGLWKFIENQFSNMHIKN